MIEPGTNSEATTRDPGLMPPWFAPDYVHGAVKPFFLSSYYVGDPLALPMIDLAYSKEKAVPPPYLGDAVRGLGARARAGRLVGVHARL